MLVILFTYEVLVNLRYDLYQVHINLHAYEEKHYIELSPTL